MNPSVKFNQNILAGVDRAAAQRFLDHFGPTHTFQTFADTERGKTIGPRILHGTLDEHFDALSRLNAAGHGIFFMVNGGDQKGRKAENVTHIRSVFVDLDGAPLEPVMDFCLEPSIVVQSSPGKYHAYWLVYDLEVAEFKPIQMLLIRKFNADKAVHDLPRVLRVPGFFHQKNEPFKVEVIHEFC